MCNIRSKRKVCFLKRENRLQRRGESHRVSNTTFNTPPELLHCMLVSASHNCLASAHCKSNLPGITMTKTWSVRWVHGSSSQTTPQIRITKSNCLDAEL
eukprot:4234352-Amphidinium_carterae.1